MVFRNISLQKPKFIQILLGVLTFHVVFSVNLAGATPHGNESITATVSGDIHALDEFYTIDIEGNILGEVGRAGGGLQCPGPTATQVFNVPLAFLQTAASDGTVEITATPNQPIDCDCADPGEFPSQVTIQLQFP